MAKRKIFKKALSTILSLSLLATALPTVVIADSASMVNGGSGGSTISEAGSVEGSEAWSSPSKVLDTSMWGYRISVRFAPLDEEKSTQENPVYDWSQSFQVGNTIYLRESPITKDGNIIPTFSGSFGSEDSVWDLMNGAKTWNETKNLSAINPFWYVVVPTDKDPEEINAIVRDTLKEFWNQGLLAGNTKGHQEVQKFLNRMVDMNLYHVQADGISEFLNGFDPANPQGALDKAFAGGGTYMNASNFRLALPDSLSKPNDNPYKANAQRVASENVEYLRSYFLNPAVLNMIAWYTRGEYDNNWDNPQAIQTADGKYVETFSVNDFVYGRYGDLGGGKYKFNRGVYKVYIEPTAYRNYGYSDSKYNFGVMTYQDLAAQHRTKTSTYSYAQSLGSKAVDTLAQAMYMVEPDESIAGQSWEDVGLRAYSEDGLKYPTKGAGLWVLSSPSINSYVEEIKRPKIIKTYVELSGLDEKTGEVTYSTIEESIEEDAVFWSDYVLDADGFESASMIAGPYSGESNIPFIEGSEVTEHGLAVLNDIVTINQNVDFTPDLEWSSATGNFPKSSNLSLNKSVEDVVGYKMGIKLPSSVDIKVLKEVMKSSVASYEWPDYMLDENYDSESWVNRKNSYISFVAADLMSKVDWDDDATLRESFEKVGANTIYRIDSVKETITDAEKYNSFADIKLGKSDGNGKTIRYEDSELAMDTPATVILRYLVLPTPSQFNYTEIVNTKTGEIEGKYYNRVIPLVKSGEHDVEIQRPTDIPDDFGEPKLIEWGISYEEENTEFQENGKMPSTEKTGTTEVTITDYPGDPEPNLFVKWRIEYSPDDPDDPDPDKDDPRATKLHVPEWRLSKYFNAYTDVGTSLNMINLTLKVGHCGIYKLTGTWKFNVLNPSGSLATALEKVSGNPWIHTKTVWNNVKNSTPSTYSPSGYVKLSGDVNAIKTSGTSGLKAANWLDSASISGLKNYEVDSSSNGGIAVKDYYVLTANLDYKLKNTDSFTNSYAVYKYRKRGHGHTTSSISIGPSSSSRLTYTNIPSFATVSFDRYNQKDRNKDITIDNDISSSNGYTTIKYRSDKSFNVFPEYGMLFDNDDVTDKNHTSIKWMVSDKSRTVKPVVYQTLNYKVWVDPTSTGNMATDTRARQNAQILFGAQGNLPVLYKGSPVNSTFKIQRASGNNNTGILTTKTYALDIDTSKVSYKDWGNDGYSNVTLGEHTNLLNNIEKVNGNGSADVEEKLIIGDASTIGGTRKSTSDKYQKVKYSTAPAGSSARYDSDTVVEFTHNLIVRGGYVIGVKYQGGSTIAIGDLASTDASLYDAIVNMNLYATDETGRAKTVLNNFAHKAEDSDVLTEALYVSKLNDRRASDDGIATPDYVTAFVVDTDHWYSEDSTVLVIKEYVTNYVVPSISVADKLSVSIPGLDTPKDKNDFFKTMKKGFLGLKYSMNINTPAGIANSYFEWDSLPDTTPLDTSDNFGEKNKPTYIVPNVSVTDTTRVN